MKGLLKATSIFLASSLFLIGCGDKEDDTGSEEDSSEETTEESEESEDTGDLE